VRIISAHLRSYVVQSYAPWLRALLSWQPVHPGACVGACAHLFVMFNARKRNGRFGTENAIQSMKRRHVHDVDDQPCDDISDAPGSETIKVRSSRGSFSSENCTHTAMHTA
jgi:hypothetical protein